VAWEREAGAAEALGLRVARVRTGVVLDRSGGALAKMLPFFRLGVGGPVAGGRQYLPWIHVDDVVGLYVARSAATMVGTGQRLGARAGHEQGVLARARARAAPAGRSRPSLAPPSACLYGQMAEIVIEGQRAVPARPLALGFAFRHPGP
jgi:NAD dependent epimerase/dehydratase family enzyme